MATEMLRSSAARSFWPCRRRGAARRPWGGCGGCGRPILRGGGAKIFAWDWMAQHGGTGWLSTVVMHAQQAAASRDALRALSGATSSGNHLSELHACGSGAGNDEDWGNASRAWAVACWVGFVGRRGSGPIRVRKDFEF
jgi:hypothetical protein